MDGEAKAHCHVEPTEDLPKSVLGVCAQECQGICIEWKGRVLHVLLSCASRLCAVEAKRNIEHPISSTEHRIPKRNVASANWAFDVRCWMFNVLPLSC